jgi:hypothetical protein
MSHPYGPDQPAQNPQSSSGQASPASYPPQQPDGGPHATTFAPAPPPPARSSSGMAIASLILGIVGTLFGLVPLTFWVAGTLGVVGLILGLAALARARRTSLPAKLPIAGSVLSVVALVLAVVGAVIVFRAVDQLGDDLQDAGKSLSTVAPDATIQAPAADGQQETTPPAPDLGSGDSGTGSSTGTHSFGEQVGWEDGVTSTVKSVKRTTFGQVATTPGPGVRISFTVVNGSDQAIDLTFPTIDVRLGADGAAAEQVFADDCGDSGNLGRLAPGRTVTGTACFAGRATAVDVSFSPGFDYNAETWTGKVS